MTFVHIDLGIFEICLYVCLLFVCNFHQNLQFKWRININYYFNYFKSSSRWDNKYFWLQAGHINILMDIFYLFQNLTHFFSINSELDCDLTLFTISAADVNISAAAIFFTAVGILVAVAAPSLAGCICGCDPRVNPSVFCSTLALHHMDLDQTLHVQTLFPLALRALIV